MRIFRKGQGPDTGLRAYGSHYTRITSRGMVVQAWPGPNKTFSQPWRWYKKSEFAYAGYWTTFPITLDYVTAINLVVGTDLVPRDVLMKAMYASLYELIGEDGVALLRTRDLATNPQLVLDLVTQDIGAILYRSSAGWVLIPPGNDGQVLTIASQTPFWADVYPVAIALASVLVKTPNVDLPNARVVGDSATIVASWSSPGNVEFRRAALSGDITSPLNSNATAIAAKAVTYGKMQDVTVTQRLLGRRSAGAGDIEEMSLTQALDFIGSPAQGDILFRGASQWQRLPAGTANKVLQTNGAAADPSWVTPSTGGGGAGLQTLPYFSDATVYLCPPTICGSSITTLTATPNLIYFLPLAVPYARTFTSIGIRVPTGGGVAGSHARYAVFALDTTTGGPGNVLADSGDVSTAVAGGAFGTISLALTAGSYFIALWTSANINVTAAAASFSPAMMSWSLGAASPAPGQFLTRSLAYGTPYVNEGALAHSLTAGGIATPLVGIR